MDPRAERSRARALAAARDLRADLLSELEAGRAMLHEPATDRAIRVVVERAAVDAAYAR